MQIVLIYIFNMHDIRLARTTIYSIAQLIIALIGISCFTILFFINRSSAFPLGSWSQYGWDYLNYNATINNVIPLNIQVLRAIACAMLILWMCFSIFIIINIFRIEDKKIRKVNLFFFGFFSWIIIPLNTFYSIKTKSFDVLVKYWITKTENELISHKYFWKALVRKIPRTKKNTKLFINTLFLYIVLISAFVGFIFIFVDLESTNPINPESKFLFRTISFFTQLTNLWIFVIVVAFALFHDSIFFDNNAKLTITAAYITVVSLVFWAVLTPSIAINGFHDNFDNMLDFSATLFYHLFTPVLFIIFHIHNAHFSKLKLKSLTHTLLDGYPYPCVYALYAYSLPFFTQYSVYGIFTNFNPDSTPFYDTESAKTSGSLVAISFLFIGALLFTVIISLTWLYTSKLSKSPIKNNLIRHNRVKFLKQK